MLRIKFLKIKNHIFLKDCEFQFYNNIEENKKPFMSLIIGANGTGKSQVLRFIINIFNNLSASQNKEFKIIEKFQNSFKIIYQFENDIYEIVGENKDISIKKNGIKIILQKLKLPKKIIALTANLNDRFPLFTSKSILNNNRYEYLGVRAASNNAFIGRNIAKTAEYFSMIISNEKNIDAVKNLFEILNFDPKCELIFKKGKNYKLFKDSYNKSNIETLKNAVKLLIDKIQGKNSSRINISYRVEKYSRVLNILQNEKINLHLISHILKQNELFSYKLDFLTKTGFENLKNDTKLIKYLTDLEIFSFDTIKVMKRLDISQSFNIKEASSGEYHLLTSLLSLVAKIKDNSLILIDEPEISLHPNWQQKYIEILNKLFDNFSSCHFIIASHSHFLVTNLKSEYSSISALQLNNGKIKVNLIKYNTFGWTPENILYNVFGVVTVRNYYYEMDIKELLHLISHNSDDYTRINEIIMRLENEQILKSDPLKLIIEEAKDYVR